MARINAYAVRKISEPAHPHNAPSRVASTAQAQAALDIPGQQGDPVAKPTTGIPYAVLKSLDNIQDNGKRRREIEHHSSSMKHVRSRIEPMSEEPAIMATQEVSEAPAIEWPYSQHSQTVNEDPNKYDFYLREVAGMVNKKLPMDSTGIAVIKIGNGKHNHINATNCFVKPNHCILTVKEKIVTLHAHNMCWVTDNDTGEYTRWEKLRPHEKRNLKKGSAFRLCPASPREEVKQMRWIQYSIETQEKIAPTADEQFLGLYRAIRDQGKCQNNNKGENTTLETPYIMTFNLAARNGGDLIPILRLRYIPFWAAKIETLWYLRGESDVDFLRRNMCKFWDKQAKENGFVGFNYGLLVNWPTKDGLVNQLDNVIEQLMKGTKSRNLVCTLVKPGEETVQQACSSSIKFSVTNNDELDLTVNQRSSDVVLGLPHDVCAWAIVSHLVRREVRIRTKGSILLSPGKLYFQFPASSAHVYKVNRQNLVDLLNMDAITNEEAIMVVVNKERKEEGMFEIARNFPGPTDIKLEKYKTYGPEMKVIQAVNNAP